MAKQSWKQQMYEQIANSQVQQVIAQQRADQLQNDFANWQKQQNDIAQLQASFAEWKNSQPTPEPIQPVQTAPVQTVKRVKEEAKTIPSLEDYFRPKTLSGRDINKETANYLQRENYQREQQKENVLASTKPKDNRTANQIVQDAIRGNNEDVQTDNIRNMFGNPASEGQNSIKNMLQAEVPSTTKANVSSDPEADKFNEVSQIVEDAAKDWAPWFTYRGSKWENPYDSMTPEQQQIVKDYVQQNKDNPNLSEDERKRLGDFLKVYGGSGESEDFNEIATAWNNSFGDKMQTLRAGIAGFFNSKKPVADLMAKGATKLPGLNQIDLDEANKAYDASVVNAMDKNRAAAEIGRGAGQIYDYAVTSPVVGAATAALGVGGVGAAAVNQLFQAGQDIAFDVWPEAQRMLKEEGQINWGELAKKFGTDVAMNFAMEVVPSLRGVNYDYLTKTVGNNADIFKNMTQSGAYKTIPDLVSNAADAIKSANRASEVPVENIATRQMIPGMETESAVTDEINNQFSQLMGMYQPETSAMRNIYSADDLSNNLNEQLANAIRANQADEAIESAAKAMPEAPANEVARTADEVADSIEDVAKTADNVSPIKAEIDDMSEVVTNRIYDVGYKVDAANNEALSKSYNELLGYEEKWAKAISNSSDIDEIRQATKDLNNAISRFNTKAKKVDPSISKDIYNKKFSSMLNSFNTKLDDYYNGARRAEEAADLIIGNNTDDALKEISEVQTAKQALFDDVRNGRVSAQDFNYRMDNLNRAESKLIDKYPDWYDNGTLKGTLEDYVPSATTKTMAEDVGIAKNTPDAPGEYKMQFFADGETPKEQWGTSKFYENSAAKRGYADKLNPEDYRYRKTNATEQMDVFKTRHKDSKDIVRDLVEADAFDDADMRGAMNTMDELMKGSVDDVRRASRLGKKISFEGREGGRVVQAMYDARLDTPTGQVREAQKTIGDAIDKRVGKGTSEALDNLYEELSQAYEKAKNKEEFAESVKKLLSDDLKNHVSKKTAKEMDSKKIKGLKKVLDVIDKGKDLKAVDFDELMDVMYKSNGGVTLSPKTQKEVYNLLQRASKYDPESYEFRRLQAQAARKVMAEVPSGLTDYVRSFLYANMLGNFKTAFSRNFFGNVAYQTLEKVREVPSAIVDSAVSLKTGKRSALSWNAGKAKAYKEGFMTGGKETFQDTFGKGGAINTTRSGQRGWKQTLANNATLYNDNTTLGHWANQVDYYVKKAMELGDRPIYEANYNEFKTELEQLVDKYGKNRVVGLEGIDDADIPEVIDKLASLRAADAVFQKKGHMSEGLAKFRDGLGEMSRGALGVDILSTASSPFTLTPGNMLEKAVEYTPLGFLKNAIETVSEIKGGGFNQRRFVEEAGRSITGLPVLGAAYLGAKKGLINGGLSTDQDERQAQIDDGFIEYGLNVPEQVPFLGGKTLDTSDLPVYGPFMQAGAAIKENGLSPSSSLQAAEAVLGGSAMQGIRRAFGADNASYSSQDSVLDNLKNTVLSSGTQFVPSLVRQTAQTTDEYKRDLGEYKSNEYYLNSIKNAIPGVRETLPIKYNTEGQPVLQNQGRNIGSKILENYVLPMNVSEYSPTELNQEASRLLESMGSPMGFVPKAARKDLRKWDEDPTVNKEYTEAQFREYKQNLGTLNSGAANALIESDFYSGLNDDTKAKTLSKVYSAMKQIAREDATGIPIDDKIAAAYKEGGTEGMINYIAGKQAAKDANLQSNSKAGQAIQEAAESGDVESANNMSQQIQLLPTLGLEKPGPQATYTKAYGVYDGLTAEDFAKTYKEIDTNNSQGLEKAEVIAYMNKHKLNQSDGMAFWQAYAKTEGGNAWKIPSIKDGVWK